MMKDKYTKMAFKTLFWHGLRDKDKDNDRGGAHFLFEGGFSPVPWALPLLR